jgi:predicted Zn-dependent protease
MDASAREGRDAEMNLPAPEWPPSTPGLANFIEVAEARDLKWFVRNYWVWIALGGLISSLLGMAWVYYFPPQYVSQAAVRFLPPQVAGRFVNPNFSMEVGQRMFALSQLLGSRLTAAKLIEANALYPERRRFWTVEDLTPKFMNDLRIVQVGNSPGEDHRAVPTLRISFAYPDAEKAQRVVQKLVEQIYEENRKYRGDQSLGTTEFLLEQLNASEEKVLETEQRLGEIQDSIGLTVSQTRLGQSTSRSYVIDSRLRDLRHDRRQQEERKATKRAEWEQLELMQKRIETRPVEFYIPEFEGMQHYWNLRERVSGARSRWERLKERYSATMPEVISAENDVKESEAAVERFHKERGTRLRNRDLEANAARISLAKLELQAIDKEAGEQMREEAELRAEAQKLREQQGTPAGQEVELLIAKREYESAKEHHNELVKKHEESRAASEMERRGQGESVEMLESASKPTEAEKPTWWMRVGIAGVLGMGLSSLWCLLLVLRDPKVLHGGHVERWAGLEVLADFAVDGQGRKRVGRGSIAALSCLVMLLSGCAFDKDAAALVRAGQAEEKAGNLPAAMLQYRMAIRKDARNGAAHAGMARMALQMGELAAARESLARAVELQPGDEKLTKQLAETSYQLYFGDPGRPTTLLREVEALGEKLRAKWPGHPDGYRILSQVLMERHRTDEAIELLAKASTTVRDNQSLRAQMAAAMFRVGRGPEAEETLVRLIAEHPRYLDAYDLLYLERMQSRQSEQAREVLVDKWSKTQELDSGLQLAAHDDARGQRVEARKLVAELESFAKGKALGMAKIGDFWLQRAEWKAAWDAYVWGRDQEAGHRAEYVGRLAEWHLAQKQTREAQQLVEKEFAKNSKSVILEAYVAAVRLGEVPADRRTEERKRLEAILAKMPASPFVRYHLGRAYLLEGKAGPAAEQFERVVRLDANYTAGWLALAEIELSQGNGGAAELRADNVLRMNLRDGKARMLRGRALAQRGKLAEAQSTFAAVIAEEPQNPEALFALALTQAGQGNPAEAAKRLKQGKEMEPKEPRWVMALAAVQAREGKYEEATRTLSEALGQVGKEEVLLRRMAELQIQMKDGKGARQSFERLVGMDGKNFEYQLGRAGAMALAGDREAALVAYGELQALRGSDLRVWLQPAALLGEMGREAQAKKAYEEALQRDRDNVFALNNLAWLLLRSGQELPRALEMVQRAKRAVRQSPEVDGTLAEAYTKMAMHRSAEAIYEEMLSYLPQSEKPRVEKLLVAVRQKSRKESRS